MINQAQLQELLDYDGEHKVLSLYLDTDLSKVSKENIKLQVKGMLKEANLSEGDDATAVEQYLHHSFDWSSPGLAIFCSRKSDFFRVYPAAVSFRNRVRVGHKPYVKPLAHLMEFYAHYGVVLVDRVGARFFEYHLGELQKTDGYMGEDVQKLKQGRGSSAVGMRGGIGGARHEDEVANRNLRDAAAAAAQFFNRKPIRRLFLGGTAENVAQFREYLPKRLLSCLAGTFTMDMNAGEHQVRKVTLELLGKANSIREKKLVDTLIAASQSPGGNAVVGLDDALQAVSEKRVDTLIVSDGFQLPGYVDEASGFVVANLAKSPLSDEELMAVEDVVDAACAFTMNQSGQVEIIRDNPDLEKVGRIGAILRY